MKRTEMEINSNERKINRPKYWALSTAAILVTAFVLVQPTMLTANAVTVEDITKWDDCFAPLENTELPGTSLGDILGDLISQNSIKKGDIIKTIHAEKEIFICFLQQGNIPVVVEVTTYVELFENITAREVIGSSSLVVSCVKDSIGDIEDGDGGFEGFTGGAQVLGCVNYIPRNSPVPVGSDCLGLNALGIPVSPMEMDSHRKGNIVKTIETQKQVYICELPDDTLKKVDIVLFTEIYENINTREILSVQNHQIRCVVLINNDPNNLDPDDDRRDATVESCIFSSVVTVSESNIPNN